MEIDDETGNNFLKEINDFWIVPELERRRKINSLPKDFKIYRCMIRLPIGEKAIIQFNDEISLVAKMKLPPKKSVSKGDPIYLHEVGSIEDVERPKHNGIDVAFVFLYYDGMNYKVIFDFTPNWPDELKQEKDIGGKWLYGGEIAKVYRNIIDERVVNNAEAMKENLKRINLWLVPSLLPYPLSEIILKLKEHNFEEAKNIFNEFCSHDFLEKRIKLWFDLKEFKDRKKLFEEAFEAYKKGWNNLSISSLVPQIEGIITDWLYSNQIKDIPFRETSKVKKFQDVVSEKEYLYRNKKIQEFFNQIFEDSFMKTFKSWVEPCDDDKVNRHKNTHGKYEPDTYSEENALRLFLMFDTLYEIIKKHEGK